MVIAPNAGDAASELVASEKELRGGRIAFGRISKAIDTLSKTEDIALRAPEFISRLHDLMQLLGLT